VSIFAQQGARQLVVIGAAPERIDAAGAAVALRSGGP
jgi:hypothetical protein